MRRHLLGLIALSSLIAGAILTYVGGGESRSLEWTSGLLRSGAVLGAVWLAMPEMRRPGNKWFVGAVLAAFILMAWRPKLFLVAAVLVVVAWIVRPRTQSNAGVRHGGTESPRGQVGTRR